jgi:DNA repair exonuclease SbcCD ATPase subunit
VERTSTAESLTRQNAELEKLQQEASKRQSLEQQLNDLPAISKPSLLDLRGLEQQLRDALTRQEAMAAGVKLLKADQPVRLDGRPLQVGDEQRLSAVFQLQVGDGVVLEIAPGGGQALGDLEQTVQDARNQLATQLAALKVDTVVAAEALLEQRNALDQQLAALGAASADPGKLEQQNAALQQRLAELDGERQDLAEVRQAMEQEQPLPESLSGLQALQQQVSATSKHTLAAVGAAEKELEAARLALQAFQTQRISEASQIEVVQAELADRRERLEPLIHQHGDREALAAKLTGLNEERQQAETELSRLNAERAALTSQDAERQQQRLQEQIDALTRRQAELLDQRGAAKQRCDSISSQDPFAAVEQARLQLETAEAEHGQLLRLTEAHKELKRLFQEAQADLSSRYSEPLARAIGDYLRPLVPDGQVARLSYDQSKGFQGLQLRRGQEYYDFGALSGGMREQLAAALRLSMADVLKEAHDGCLPLVFDDAFTNSDPERIDLVKRMLGTAVDRGLQVILLTCDPTAYGAFADAVVELGSG